MRHYLAFDLGAESGRAVLGALDGSSLRMRELRRFPNQPVALPGGLYWDALRLFHEMREALSDASRLGVKLDGIGIDTWGVDFALLGANGEMLANPRHYRDPHTEGVPEKLFAVVPRERVFETTGIQFMPLNSLYQWYALRLAGSPALAAARHLLFMPDLFAFWLTGVMRTERTIASTSQFYDPRSRSFAEPMLQRLGLDPSILPPIAEPGSMLGPLLPAVAQATGVGAVPVFSAASHDTASAVAGVPASAGPDWCYISSGTWSLMGVEVPEPVITSRCRELNFTNEAGAGGRIRLLKNIAGLWLLQECRRAWQAEGHDFSYADLASLAEEAGPAGAVVDPDDFSGPGGMPARIAARCRDTGQRVPARPGEVVRVVLESLAHCYARTLAGLEELTGRRIEVIHIVGGGSKNALLNRLTAEITGRWVIAGPAEATAAGNILVQAIGGGQIRDLDAARAVERVWEDA